MPNPGPWKYFLLDEDPQLRESVGFYFYESWPQDRELVPLVLASCRRYGVQASLTLLSYAHRFPIGPLGLVESLRVLSSKPAPFVEQWVSKAPLALLTGPADVVRSVLSPHALSRLDRRLTLAKSTLPELWRRLESSCRTLDADAYGTLNWEELEDVIEALAEVELHEPLLEKVSTLASVESPHLRRAFVALGGAASLRSHAWCLLESMDDADECLGGEAVRSLARSASDAAVRAIEISYPRRGVRFQRRALLALRAMKCESAESLLRSLLESEENPRLRDGIIDALRFHFTPKAEDALRRELTRSSSATSAQEIRKALSVLSRLRENAAASLDRPRNGQGFMDGARETYTRA